MNIYVVSIFPEVFEWFLQTSLIQKAVKSKILKFKFINPRDFCTDKHKQIDDEIYGWWTWMLMKAKPIIDSVENIIKKIKWTFKIIYLAPSEEFFTQKKAFQYSKLDNIIYVCWRYEWIDSRFEFYMADKYKKDFEKISIWKYVLMWWEVASMVLIEASTRLITWVIKEQESFLNESYILEKNMKNIEYPQYTRPEEVYWMKVPETLLSWHHKNIEKWKQDNTKTI